MYIYIYSFCFRIEWLPLGVPIRLLLLLGMGIRGPCFLVVSISHMQRAIGFRVPHLA